MPIKINQNIFSMITQRNLNRASGQVERAFERLSSGERINRSADDPAGMATSEALRFEIQGLRQNQLNISGTLGVVGTAESHLENLNNLMQRARELAVQAASDTLSPANRTTIQNEINELLDEAGRIATSARYGDKFLLNGTLSNARIQVGTIASETLSLTLPDFRTGTLGAYAQRVSDQGVSTAALSGGTVLLNGTAIPDSRADGLSTAAADASAIAKAAAINSIESQTGVHADVLPATHTGLTGISAVSLDGATRSLSINGINIGNVNVSIGDGTGTLVNRINAYSAQTGVTASVDSSWRLTLNAADGRNIRVQTTGSVGDELGLVAVNGDAALTATGKLRLTSAGSYTLNDPAGALGFAGSPLQVNADPALALANLSVSDGEAAAQALLSLDMAIRQISDGRAVLGALHNRLEGLTSQLAQKVEDLTSADSRIRDTDFAAETARLTQSQILQEAAIAMLSQANVTPRKALELLSGN